MIHGLRYRTGILLDEFPFFRIGKGPENLVVLPGLGDALQDARKARWTHVRLYLAFARHYTVHVISRKRGMPEGYTIRDMVADYARVLKEVTGPANVLGLSMGGCIAEELAAAHPEWVQRLILVASSHRQAPNGQELANRWGAWARQGRWQLVCSEFASMTFTGIRKPLYELLVPIFVRLRRSRLAHPSDFLVSMDACLNHDATERLPFIQAPTLVIGGDRDRFIPESMIAETAGRIPNSKLHIVKGLGHGVFVERKRVFNRLVKEFLQDGNPSPP